MVPKIVNERLAQAQAEGDMGRILSMFPTRTFKNGSRTPQHDEYTFIDADSAIVIDAEGFVLAIHKLRHVIYGVTA